MGIIMISGLIDRRYGHLGPHDPGLTSSLKFALFGPHWCILRCSLVQRNAKVIKSFPYNPMNITTCQWMENWIFWNWAFWPIVTSECQTVNLRRAGGRGCLNTPQVFAAISKTAALRTAIFETPVDTSLPHMWKFQTQVTQGHVTRSLQVTSPQKSFNARHSYTECPITLKLSAIDIRTSIFKIYTSEFWYRWPKVRSILWLHHYKSIGKMKSACFWSIPFETLSNIGLQVDVTHWVGILPPVTPRHVAKVISGHERSPAVFRQ